MRKSYQYFISIILILILLNSCVNYELEDLFIECDAPHNISYILVDDHNYSPDNSIPITNEDIKTIHIDGSRKSCARYIFNRWPEFIKTLPNNTLTVFIFHTDTVSHYTWDQIRQEYKVLVRYDIGVEDYNMLPGTNKSVTIPYPPAPSMESVHMYPPYDQVMAQYDADCQKIATMEEN